MPAHSVSRFKESRLRLSIASLLRHLENRISFPQSFLKLTVEC